MTQPVLRILMAMVLTIFWTIAHSWQEIQPKTELDAETLMETDTQTQPSLVETTSIGMRATEQTHYRLSRHNGKTKTVMDTVTMQRVPSQMPAQPNTVCRTSMCMDAPMVTTMVLPKTTTHSPMMQLNGPIKMAMDTVTIPMAHNQMLAQP